MNWHRDTEDSDDVAGPQRSETPPRDAQEAGGQGAFDPSQLDLPEGASAVLAEGRMGWMDLFGLGGSGAPLDFAPSDLDGPSLPPPSFDAAPAFRWSEAPFAADVTDWDPSQAVAALRWPFRDLLQQRSTEQAAPAEATSGYTGAGQTVVVIDTGYSTLYDQSNTALSYDFYLRGDADASTTGYYSHGSWVAETVLSVAPDTQIIHLKVFDDGGETAFMRDIEQALDYVIELAETTSIAAVNLSLGFDNATVQTTTRLSDEFAELDALGVMSIVAAGNMGETYDDGVNVLAADPNVIAVSAVDESGAFADFSQTDAELTDIAALGVDVEVSAMDGTTFEVDGTSFAAPEIAGMAALMQEASLDLTGETLSDDAFLELLQGSGESVAGYEGTDIDGYRIADADAALDALIESTDGTDGFLV
ncbi:MAG: S8/S53 family peptidase [Pseudomonadota bacterium]